MTLTAELNALAAQSLARAQSKLNSPPSLPDAEAISRWAHSVAYAEGEAHALARVAPPEECDWDDERVAAETLRLALSLATAGADDSGSGRGNDLRRSRHEGVLAALSSVSDHIRYRVIV